MDRSNFAKDAVFKYWVTEQERIAEQVQILPDELDDESDNASVKTRTGRHIALPLTLDAGLYGGVDVSFITASGTGKEIGVAVYVVIDLRRNMQIVYQDHAVFVPTVPYVPSYLAMREIDPLLRLVQHQRNKWPDVTPNCILVDGNGIWHQRRAGLACHLGVACGLPTIGISKTFYCLDAWNAELVSNHINASLTLLRSFPPDVGNDYSADEYVLWDTSVRAACMCQDDRLNADEKKLLFSHFPKCRGIAVPISSTNDVTAVAIVGHGGLCPGQRRDYDGTSSAVFVSVGHKVSVQKSVRICAKLSLTRIPEPVRQADLLGRKILQSNTFIEASIDR